MAGIRGIQNSLSAQYQYNTENSRKLRLPVEVEVALVAGVALVARVALETSHQQRHCE